MNYRAPPLPVDLRYLNSLGNTELSNLANMDNPNARATQATEDVLSSEEAREAQIREFRQIALNKHNIRLS